MTRKYSGHHFKIICTIDLSMCRCKKLCIYLSIGIASANSAKFRGNRPWMYIEDLLEALPGVLGNRKPGIYFRGTREQRPSFEGNRGTKTILGNREHKKTNFRFLGNRGTSQFISGEQGNRYPPPPPERASYFDNARLFFVFLFFVFCLFVCFVALRPKSTAMVMGLWREVQFTSFPGLT